MEHKLHSCTYMASSETGGDTKANWCRVTRKLCWHCCDQWADFGQLFLERREEINKTTPCFSQIVALIKQEFLCAFAVYANSALH